jgi:hypothetical protein
MDLLISHSCPSCGGPVEMQEADRLTSCVFCGVQNYMVNSGLLRYVLPDKIPEHITREKILYFPYLRFKGNMFTCQGLELDTKVLDTTHRGLETQLLPLSLGLKPQAMKVALVNSSHTGLFFRRKDTAVSVLQRASLVEDTISEINEQALNHRAFIGESVSCIYLPLYIENGMVYDGILNRKLGIAESWMTDGQSSVRHQHGWEPHFLATICPQCGASMHGEHDGLVMNCYNCDSCWAEKNGKFVPVPYTLLIPENPNSVQLPFWRISVETKGIRMQTVADFLRATNQPVVVNWEHEERDLEFLVPAMKLRPKIFLQLAKSATLLQLKFPVGERKLQKPLYPVTLPLKEAVQALKSIVAEATVNKKDVLPQLPNLTFEIKRTSLALLPFVDTGHDLVQEHSSLAVASSVVQFGRKL